MKNCKMLSKKDNSSTRKVYQSPKCITQLIATDIVTSSVQSEEAGYTWAGNGWSEGLGDFLK